MAARPWRREAASARRPFNWPPRAARAWSLQPAATSAAGRLKRSARRAAINYKTENFVEAVSRITAKRGVDVILDIVGGAYVARNLECLARDGRLVQIGLMGGASAEVPMRTILLKRLTITGSTLRIRTAREKGAIAQALEREVWPPPGVWSRETAG